MPLTPRQATAPATPEPVCGAAGAVAVEDWRSLRSQHLDTKAKLARCRKDCDRLVREVKAQHKVRKGAYARARCRMLWHMRHAGQCQDGART